MNRIYRYAMSSSSVRCLGAMGLCTTIVFGSMARAEAASATSDAGGKTLQIGALVYDTTIPYFTPMIDGENQAAKDLNSKIDVQNGQSDLSKEIAIIQQFISQGKDVMVVTASDSKGIAPIIKVANQAGIPVIANNTVIIGAESVTYVGSDNVTYGRTLAKAACGLLKGHGKVAVIEGVLGSSPQFDRKAGIEAEFAEKCPGVTILADQTANWDNAQALSVGQDFLNKYGPGKIDAIIDEGPEGVAPARWAHQNGRDDVKWILGDVPKAVAAAIRDGYVAAAVWQDPKEQGYKSVENAVNWVRGNKDKVPRPRDYSGNLVIDSTNIDTVKPY
ncbi:MAG: sugar ABC transporter substrate-binding protein [Roseiarcus sp.]